MIRAEMIAPAGLDGFRQVPGMLGRQRLGFQAAGAGSPLVQRVVSVAAPADAWVVSPDVAGCDGAAYFGVELVGPGPAFAEDALAPVGAGQ
jgi:hypothetical protein